MVLKLGRKARGYFVTLIEFQVHLIRGIYGHRSWSAVTFLLITNRCLCTNAWRNEYIEYHDLRCVRLENLDLDLQIWIRTQNLKTDFVEDFSNGNP